MNDEPAKIAFFWDKSFLWGIIAWKTFRELGIGVDLLSGADIRAGGLKDHRLVFVPGGWASDKIVALGKVGCERILDYVSAGGGYLGICGGAGLALTHENGLSLVPVGRMPTSARVPSFSGQIGLKQSDPTHPAWVGIKDGTRFHAWWPGQFSLDESEGVEILARYEKPGEGSFVTDLPVLPGMDWRSLEKSYGINLDPKRLEEEPAVIESRFGEGLVLLSYLHFETPDDPAGHRVILNFLSYLSGNEAIARSTHDLRIPTPATKVSLLIEDLLVAIDDLIDFGRRNYLWYDRNDWILMWRRGVRGVEYSTLRAMIGAIHDNAGLIGPEDADLIARLEKLREISMPFFSEAKMLLSMERDAMSRGLIRPLKTDDPKIRDYREKLFSNSKRCGGLYEEIIELADEVLLPLLQKTDP